VSASSKAAAPLQRRIVNPWSWQDAFGFVQANDVSGTGRTIFCAGQTSVDENGRPLHPGDMSAQLESALDNLQVVLEAAGARLSDVVRLNYFTTDTQALLAAWETLTTRLDSADCRPASTLLGVQALAFPELLIELEATAITSDTDPNT
jgi:enamine deaminase RidA (YjgF/YER057c/UK114 family)